MHEIVTIQIGEQSNYLGTHFWNTQASHKNFQPMPNTNTDWSLRNRTSLMMERKNRLLITISIFGYDVSSMNDNVGDVDPSFLSQE
jgi:hypothetical protein